MKVLRRGLAGDVDRIFALKTRLGISSTARRVTRGGFLLGAPRARYAWLIEHANVLVLEEAGAGTLYGFTVTLPDPILRSSDLWLRRAAIDWDPGAPALGDDTKHETKIGYFDQIACAPGHGPRVWAPALALAALLDLLQAGHQHVFATVAREPVHNVATLPMLAAVGARRVGQIDEHYDGFGTLLSDVYHLDRSPPAATPWRDTALGRRVLAMVERVRGAEAPLSEAAARGGRR